MIGTVKTVAVERGFGFIDSPDSDEDLFFHVKDMDQQSLDWDEQLKQRRVRFEIIVKNGRERAVNVRPAD